MITDANGDELTYWPLTLIEGEDSDPIQVTIDVPAAGGYLVATDDDRVDVFAKVGGGPWVNIKTNPLSLSAYAGSSLDLDVYVTATGPVEGLERVPITVSAGHSGGAGWTI